MQEIWEGDIRKCEYMRLHDECNDEADDVQDDAPVVRRYTRALKDGKWWETGLRQANRSSERRSQIMPRLKMDERSNSLCSSLTLD
jgi:hypothetical protein